jgi:hypothetical protein
MSEKERYAGHSGEECSERIMILVCLPASTHNTTAEDLFQRLGYQLTDTTVKVYRLHKVPLLPKKKKKKPFHQSIHKSY